MMVARLLVALAWGVTGVESGSPAGGLAPDIQLSNGDSFPRASFGLQVWPNPVATNRTLMALDAGFRNFFASVLASNQPGFGAAVAQSAVPRSEMYICGSVNTGTCAGFQGCHGATKAGCDTNIRDTQLQYFDMIMLDYPSHTCEGILGQWAAFEEMLAAGKTRALAVSNFNQNQLDCILRNASATVPVVNQLPFHPTAAGAADTVTSNRGRGIVVQAWSPLAHGSVLQNQAAQLLGQRHNKSAAQVAFRWIVQMGATFTTQSGSLAHLKEDLDIYDFSLNETEMHMLGGTNANMPPAASPPSQTTTAAMSNSTASPTTTPTTTFSTTNTTSATTTPSTTTTTSMTSSRSTSQTTLMTTTSTTTSTATPTTSVTTTPSTTVTTSLNTTTTAAATDPAAPANTTTIASTVVGETTAVGEAASLSIGNASQYMPVPDLQYVKFGNRTVWAVDTYYRIAPVRLTGVTLQPGGQPVPSDSIRFRLEPTPLGFVVSGGTGEIIGSPVSIQRIDSQLIAVLARPGASEVTAVIANLTFDQRPADTVQPASGPSGRDCAHGTVVDDVEFDQAFTCDCTGTSFHGENCDVADAPSGSNGKGDGGSNGTGSSPSLMVICVAAAGGCIVTATAIFVLHRVLKGRRKRSRSQIGRYESMQLNDTDNMLSFDEDEDLMGHDNDPLFGL